MRALILTAVLLGMVRPANASDGTWQYRELYNPVEETRIYIASVEAAAAEIELRCSAKNRRAEARMRLPVGRNHTADVQLRFDNTRPQTLHWQPSISRLSLSLAWADMASFSQALSAYHQVHVRLPHLESEGAFSISLKKSSQAIANLGEHCRFK